MSPGKKLGGRKHKQSEKRWKLLSNERIQGCSMALGGCICHFFYYVFKVYVLCMYYLYVVYLLVKGS